MEAYFALLWQKPGLPEIAMGLHSAASTFLGHWLRLKCDNTTGSYLTYSNEAGRPATRASIGLV